MGEEDADAQQRQPHQNAPRQMGFHPVHGKQRAMRNLTRGRTQPRFIGHVVDCVEAHRDQQRLQQNLRRRHADVKAEHQNTGQREAEEKGQQKQQREKNVEVKAYPTELKPGGGGDKQRRQQPDHQQPAKLH